MDDSSILITGCAGQLGRVLYDTLVDKYGSKRIIASDIDFSDEFEQFFLLDIMDRARLEDIIRKNEVKTIFHLAAMLSAKGEQKPLKAWDININGYLNVLETARTNGVKRIFYPSTIGVFGSEIPLVDTPQHVPLIPSTVYGISKAAGENWGKYYYDKYRMDVRALRFPGVIGYQSMPGGGTTDYAVEIFHEALKNKRYTCFLQADERLPMIYMDDAMRATIKLMEAPAESISVRTAYNLQGVSFSPNELALAIKKLVPGFSMTCEPDYRQVIASSWPDSLDDSMARADWGWQPKYDLDLICRDMIENLKKRHTFSS